MTQVAGTTATLAGHAAGCTGSDVKTGCLCVCHADPRTLYVRGLVTLEEVAERLPLLCVRAAVYGDCPVGHEWGDDPRVRLPLHYSARAHADALAWAEAHALRCGHSLGDGMHGRCEGPACAGNR